MNRAECKARAVLLRSEGHSYSYIAQSLNVSKSTLSDWLSGIPYIPNHETIARIGRARAASGAAKTKIRNDLILLASQEAARELGRLSKRDAFMLGLGLYIGEGSKTADIIRFVNSDPHVINAMIRWFTEVLNVPKANVRIRLHLYPDCNEIERLRYWSKVTTIPESQFQRTSFDRRENKKAIRSGKLIHGTAHVSITSGGEKKFGVHLFRKILAWTELALQSKRD